MVAAAFARWKVGVGVGKGRGGFYAEGEESGVEVGFQAGEA